MSAPTPLYRACTGRPPMPSVSPDVDATPIRRRLPMPRPLRLRLLGSRRPSSLRHGWTLLALAAYLATSAFLDDAEALLRAMGRVLGP